MKGFAISLGLHLAVLFALFCQWPAAPAPATVPRTAVKLFIPADAIAENAPPPKRRDARPSIAPQHLNPAPQSKAKLDLAALQLTVEDDVHGEMIVVLKRYRGKIVIFDPGTRAVKQAFWASTATPVSGVAVTEGLAILLGDPAYWPEVVTLEGADRADAAVCALFPLDFADALGAAIQKKATATGVVDIKTATVAFSASEPSGIVIRHVR
jgi:hypothetical protein